MRCAIRNLLAMLVLVSASARAQELTLRQDCEVGFRKLIAMAQDGALGDEVTNANVSVDGKHTEVELVGREASGRRFTLTPKQSTQTFSRFFDIIPATGGSETDAARLGAALNAAFAADPFHLVGLEGMPGDDPIPPVLTAWTYGGFHGVARVLERRMMVLASLPYTVAVMLVLGMGLAATTIILCVAVPPSRRM